MKISQSRTNFLYLLLIYSFTASAQNLTIDSLKKVLQTQKEDTNKVNLLNELSNKLSNYADEKAMEYASKALTLSEKINFKKGKGYAYNNIGMINCYPNHNYSEALKNANTALKIFEESNDKAGMAMCYRTFGEVYTFQANYSEAMKNYSVALKFNQEAKNKQGIANSYWDIAGAYSATDNLPQALKNFYVALKLFEEIGAKEDVAYTLRTIGDVYSSQNNYSEALKNYRDCIKFFEESGDKVATAWCYFSIGTVYFNQGNYTEALKNDSTAIKLFEESGFKRAIFNTYLAIGKISEKLGDLAYSTGDFATAKIKYNEALKNYILIIKDREENGWKEGLAWASFTAGNLCIKLNNIPEAKYYIEKSFILSKEIGTKSLFETSYKALAQLDSAQGNFRQAFEHNKLYNIYHDSIANEEEAKKSAEMRMNFEFEKKESAAKAKQDKKDAIAKAELEKEKLMRNAYAAGGILLLLLSGVLYNRYRLKQKSNKQLAEKNSIITIEKQRSEDLLHNILPEEVAEELKQKGSASAKQFDEVTVMFTDFKGFTQISEKLTPAELVAEIDTCFKAFDNIITKHNIEKIKTIGDSYMCAGGLPVVNKTNATDVVNAAREIQKFMQEYAEKKIKEGKEIFEIRIGVHTGPVVAGIVGVKKFAYDIWGDTVNIASRMESSGEAGKVNISGATYNIVRDKFNCTHRGKIEAKHKGEIDMYFVESIL